MTNKEMLVQIRQSRSQSNFYKIFKDDVKLLGFETAGLLSIITDLYGDNHNSKEWVRMTVDRIKKKSFGHFTKKIQLRMLKKLESIGIISMKKSGNPASRYIRIHLDKLGELIADINEGRTTWCHLVTTGGYRMAPLYNKDIEPSKDRRTVASNARHESSIVFFTDKEGSPKVGRLIPSSFDYDCAERLHEIVVNTNKRRQAWSHTKWAHEFRILRKSMFDDSLAEARISKSLNWYVQNAYKKRPKIDSAAGFRKLFDWIEREAEITNKDNVPITDKDVVPLTKELIKLRWPKGSEKQLPQTIQLSITSLMKLRKLRKKVKDPMAKPLQDYAMPVSFIVKDWLVKIHDQIKNWDEWSGKLTSLALDWESERFDKMLGEMWGKRFWGSKDRWYDFKKLLLERKK